MKRILLITFMLVSALVTVSWAQTRSVTGTVTSAEDGATLPGVNVILKGTTTGTVTDIDGNYRLNIPEEGATLTFTFIGLASQDVVVGARSVVDVVMESDVEQLGEVVITAQGQERSKRSLGYSTAQVSSEEITQGRTSDPLSALQGKVAGVNISSASGAPGASTSVILRGYSSVSGSNNPLYVVDGVPINNSAGDYNQGNVVGGISRTVDYGNRANDINPDDIASVSILKGASATALYGSRAANGAILITTKKGKRGDRPKVSLTSSATFSRPLRIPEFQNTYGQGWSGNHDLNENGSWGPVMDGKDRVWGEVVNNSQLIKPFASQEDNMKDFYETGSSYINTVSVSGGSDMATYYASYGYLNQDGVIPSDNDSQKRHTIGLRGSIDAEKLKITTSVNYVDRNVSAIAAGQGGDGTTTFQELIQIPRDFSIVDFKDYNNQFHNLDNFYTEYAQNPYWSIYENGNEFNEQRIYGAADVTYNFTDWFSATYRLGADVANSQIKEWIAVGETTPGSPNGSITQIPGQVTDRTRFARELNHDILLTFENKIGEEFQLTTLVGGNLNERYFRNQSTTVNDLDIPEFYFIGNSSGTPIPDLQMSKRRLFGVYGQLEAAYKNFLFLNLQARNDWSSTLPLDNNTFFYPGANLSFVFTEFTPGLQGVLDFGKIRASWGQTGNDADPYEVYSQVIGGEIYIPFGAIRFPFANLNGYEIANQIGNNQLSPEITTEYEFGTELQFFGGRLGLDATYYNRTTDGQILAVPTSPSSGYTSQTLNLGEVQNKGIELMANIVPIETNDFSWNLSYNFTRNRNEVLSLTQGLEKVSLIPYSLGVEMRAVPGQPLGALYGYTYERDSEGRIIVNEANGIPLATDTMVHFGDVNPDYTMGLTNNLKYKGFGLSFSLDYRHGGLFYSATQDLSYFVGNALGTTYNDRKPFIIPNSVIAQGEGDEVTYVENTTPIDKSNINNYFNDTSNPGNIRDRILDRTFFKLREVVLSYTLPNRLLDRTFISQMQVSVIGRNLFLWTPSNNRMVDPESTTFGNDLLGSFGEFAVGPTSRSLGISLNATF